MSVIAAAAYTVLSVAFVLSVARGCGGRARW
jgi:hypothetical protein